MPNAGHDLPHPITNHLRDAADHIRLTNHATHGDYREVTDLYDTFGALSAVLKGIPQLVAHLHHLLDRTDAGLYETDGGSPAAETLSSAELATDEAFSKVTTASNAIDDAWSAIGRLRIHDPDATDPA
jgi:hypothetical protein